VADFGWMIIPWLQREKSRFHELIDFIVEGSGLLEYGDKLEAGKPSEVDNKPFDEAADQLLFKSLDLVKRMKEWLLSANMVMTCGPTMFTLDPGALTKALTERIRMRGYSKRTHGSPDSSFDHLENARLIHMYWTVVLDLYMAILGNPSLCKQLGPQLGHEFASSEINMRAECRCLADDISIYGELCSQNVWQSFGPMGTYSYCWLKFSTRERSRSRSIFGLLLGSLLTMLTVCTWSLRTALRWYQDHDQREHLGVDDPNKDLHQAHCLILLQVLRSQSKG
jgi:hypothetical protein